LLRCSNCFLIVSPLFLLCRLGAGFIPRAFFLPGIHRQQNQSFTLTCPHLAASHPLNPSALALAITPTPAYSPDTPQAGTHRHAAHNMPCENVRINHAAVRYCCITKKAGLARSKPGQPYPTIRGGVAGTAPPDIRPARPVKVPCRLAGRQTQCDNPVLRLRALP
jgi:hypothetical protein